MLDKFSCPGKIPASFELDGMLIAWNVKFRCVTLVEDVSCRNQKRFVANPEHETGANESARCALDAVNRAGCSLSVRLQLGHFFVETSPAFVHQSRSAWLSVRQHATYF